MKHQESQLQQACVKYFDYQYPKLRLNFFKVHNEGSKNIVSASINKAEGLRAGVADIFLAMYSGKVFHSAFGLFIEFKSEKGKQTETQKEFQKAVEVQGYKYIIIRTVDEFVKQINEYLK